MKKSIAALFVIALTLALALFTGTALAGGSHGGGHDGKTDSQAQQSQPAQQDSHASKQDSTVQTGGDNSHGVKPDNTTKHDTHATAGSGYTKQYGNGKTAGQIAEQNGAKPDTVLHGPGNSQPHKVAVCPKGHEVDVHALKAHGGDCAATESKQSQPQAHEQKQQEKQKHEVEHVSSETKSVSHETKSSEAESEKVFICHATGSSTNPYVLIHVSKDAEWAHTHHQDGRDVVLGNSSDKGCPQAAPAQEQSVTFCDMSSPTQGKLETKPASKVLSHELNGTPEEARDIVPPFTVNGQSYSQLWDANGQAIFNAGCSAPASTAAAAVTTTTTTTTVPVTTTVESTSTVQATTTVATTTTAAGVAGASTTTTTPAAGNVAAANTSAPQGGVLGAQATLKPRTSPHGGVLGTIRSTTLPFTGLPLWPVVLGALALIGAGAAVRRTQRGTL